MQASTINRKATLPPQFARQKELPEQNATRVHASSHT